MNSTKTQTEELTDIYWPPVVHWVWQHNRPLKPGDYAICGAKLEGNNLGPGPFANVCKKCEEIRRQAGGL